MGPIELADTVGLDICMAVGTMLRGAGRDDGDGDGGSANAAPPIRLKQLIDSGKLGKKSGEGFYQWPNGTVQKPAADPKQVPPGLTDRLINPLLEEAQSALDEKIVDDADLVDAGSIFGFGFAPHTGGPMNTLAMRAAK